MDVRRLPLDPSYAAQMSQCLRDLPGGQRFLETMAHIAAAFRRDNDPWILAYSGGKDSTAVLKLVFQALLRLDTIHKPLCVIYCDTGVEIPAASALARGVLRDLEAEVQLIGLPITMHVLSPRLKDRFFVKIIGRGYPPPTDKFRWCTDRLRIEPVARFLAQEHVSTATIVLGLREAESATRSLTLKENQTQFNGYTWTFTGITAVAIIVLGAVIVRRIRRSKNDTKQT